MLDTAIPLGNGVQTTASGIIGSRRIIDTAGSGDTFTTEAAEELLAVFSRSSIQRLAYDTIKGDILHCDYWWTTRLPDGRTFKKKIEVNHWQHGVWNTFVGEVLLQLCLFGYAVYRVATAPADDGKSGTRIPGSFVEEGDKVWYPEVASGDSIHIYWNDAYKKWVPIAIGGENFNADDGWHLAMMAEPYKVGPDKRAFFSSLAATSFSDTIRLENLLANITRRDDLNSVRSVWTSVGKQFGPMLPGGGTPGFEPVLHSGMVSVPRMMSHDFDNMLANRVEAIQKLHEASIDLRAATRQMIEKPGKRGGRPEKKRKTEHDEYAVTEGMEGRETQHLRAPEDLPALIDRLINNILFSWQVPPQVLGKNINSERLASSNRLSEAALHRYTRLVDAVRGIISLVIEKVSSDISGSNRTVIRLFPCISEHTLHTLESVMKPEVVKMLYACTYGVPEEYFDIARIKKKQDAMLLEAAGPATRNRQPQTEEQKDAKMRAKNEAGEDRKPSDKD